MIEKIDQVLGNYNQDFWLKSDPLGIIYAKRKGNKIVIKNLLHRAVGQILDNDNYQEIRFKYSLLLSIKLAFIFSCAFWIFAIFYTDVIDGIENPEIRIRIGYAFIFITIYAGMCLLINTFKNRLMRTVENDFKSFNINQ